LFVGPGRVEANPWESTYVSSDNTIFQKVTLEVRKAFVSQELLPAAYPNVADDHIALELDFMAALAGRADDAYRAADCQKFRTALEASRDFLDKHDVDELFADTLSEKD
jgi:TorA maturation chaperone TorD